MPDVRVLRSFVADDPRGYAELIIACGRLLDAWLDAGGEPSDDTVVRFYGIFSQSLDLKRPGDTVEEAEFYAWGYPLFLAYRDELHGLIRSASS